MELHTVDKEKPTEKLVGRKGKTGGGKQETLPDNRSGAPGFVQCWEI
jgi:hypothetical protein